MQLVKNITLFKFEYSNYVNLNFIIFFKIKKHLTSFNY